MAKKWYSERTHEIKNQLEAAELLLIAAKETLEELRDEQEDKIENLPESLLDSPNGEIMQERFDALEELIDGFETFIDEYITESKDQIEAFEEI